MIMMMVQTFFKLFFIFCCTRSSLLHTDFLYKWWRGLLSLWCAGFSLQWLLLFQSTASEFRSFTTQAQSLWHTGLFAFMACGIFPDQGLNPCPLHLQVYSYPLYHQGSSMAQIFLPTRKTHLAVPKLWEQVPWSRTCPFCSKGLEL